MFILQESATCTVEAYFDATRNQEKGNKILFKTNNTYCNNMSGNFYKIKVYFIEQEAEQHAGGGRGSNIDGGNYLRVEGLG